MIKTISTEKAPQAIGPYSQAIVASPFLFISGQIPLTPNGDLIDGNVTDQAKQVMTNIEAILDSQKLTFNDVIKVTIFLSDMNDFNEVNEIYSSFLGNHKPARSTVEVSKLPKNVKIEIETIAYIG